MTAKTLERIKQANLNIYMNIISLKKWHNSETVNHDCSLAEIRGFLTGLVLTGFISEQEKKVIFCYITL